MSYHVDFPYMIPNGSASSSSQRAEMESDVRGQNYDYMDLFHTGDASIPTSVPSLSAQSETVATSAASSGNPIFPFPGISQAQSQSSHSYANPHDLGCPIGSPFIDPSLLQSGGTPLDLPFEDRGSHHSLQEAHALRARLIKRLSHVSEYIERIESQIPNNSRAHSTIPAPVAYGQWTPATAGAGYGDAHGSGFLAENFTPVPVNSTANPPSFPHGNSPQANHTASIDLSYNAPYPPFDSSNFMPWDLSLAAGNTFTNDSRSFEGQMGTVDVQMSGMPTPTVSGPSQMSNFLDPIFSTGHSCQSSNSRDTSPLETSGPSANVPSPSPPEQERSRTPNIGSASPSPSASDRRSIPCPINTCDHSSTTKRDMQRHIDDKHDDRPNDLIGTEWSLSEEIPCSYGHCELKFRRKDRLKRHVEKVHRR